jgi:hypothetical protein
MHNIQFESPYRSNEKFLINVLMKSSFNAVVLRPLDPHGQFHAFGHFHDDGLLGK